MAKRLSRRRLLEIPRGPSLHERPCAGRVGCRPSRRRASAPAIRHGRRTPRGKSSIAKWRGGSSKCARRFAPVSAPPSTRTARKSSRNSRTPTTSATRSGLTQSLGWVGAWTSRAERLRRRRQDDRGRRRGGQFRPRPQSAAGGEGRRPQLSGNIQRRQFAARLDAAHERGRRCTTRSSAPVARAARSRSRPCRSKLARSGAMSMTR